MFPVQGLGLTVKQLNRMANPVASSCYNPLMLRVSSRFGVTRNTMEVVGRSSSGGRMDQSISLPLGRITRLEDVARGAPTKRGALRRKDTQIVGTVRWRELQDACLPEVSIRELKSPSRAEDEEPYMMKLGARFIN